MTPSMIIALVAVFVAVAFIAGSIAWLAVSQQAPERRRLEQLRAAPTGLLEKRSLTADETKIVKRLSALIPKSPKQMGQLKRRMVRAGYHGTTPLAVFSAARLVCPIVFGSLPLIVLPFSDAMLYVAMLGIVGFLLPGFVLERIIAKRQKVIRNGLPDALDLLIVCLEAGSSIDQGIAKVADELELAYPALAEELQMIITETRAGKPRLEAFRNFAKRTGVDDVRALVAMLVQTDRFGTSVSQALRTHAETSRTKRRQRAEERAAKIGVKLVFPLVFLLFPAFFTVTLGPAIIRFIRVFFGQVVQG
jgi:tight adherence protein C